MYGDMPKAFFATMMYDEQTAVISRAGIKVMK